MLGLAKAYDRDIRARIADQNLAAENLRAEVLEFKTGVVFEDGGVKVTAFEVDHGDLLKPAVGFRVDYGGRSITISGDTRFSENLIKHAAGTELLIHQVAAVREELLKNPAFRVILAHHTQPEEAGVLFTRVKPKLAVFYHFVLLGAPGVTPVTEKEVFDMARKSYDGPLLIGEDLMAFRVERDAVVPMPVRNP
jgi:ribonuclease Z